MLRARVAAVLLACLASVACGSRTGTDLDLAGDDAEAGATEGGTGAGTGAHDAASDGALEAGAAPSFQVGEYKCQSFITSSTPHVDGVGGGSGMLAVMQSGDTVSAVYTGDTFVTGTLAFGVTALNTAVPSRLPQTLDVLCVATTTAGSSRGTLSLSSAALTVDGATLFLSFQGTIGDGPCQDAPTTGSLTCAMQ